MDEIKRKDIDDIGRRNNNKDSFKNRVFAGNRSATDRYTGERIYYSRKNHFTLDKTAQVDHVTPINRLIEDNKDAIKAKTLTKNDLKEMANADYNLAATSGRINQAKGDKKNHEYLIKQWRKGDPESLKTTYNMLEAEVVSETGHGVETSIRKAGHQIQNMGGKNNAAIHQMGKQIKRIGRDAGEVAAAGAQAGMITLTVSGIHNLIEVGRGNKSLKEGAKDTALDGGVAALSGAGIKVATKGLEAAGAKSASKFLAKFAAERAAMIAMVGVPVAQYLNGDISGEQCAADIIAGVTGSVAYGAGNLFGGPIGGAVACAVATIVVTTITSTVLGAKRDEENNAKRVAEFNRIMDEAASALKAERERLLAIYAAHDAQFMQMISEGFANINAAVRANDTSRITDGLNLILAPFHESAYFSSVEEFDEFFDQPDAEFVL